MQGPVAATAAAAAAAAAAGGKKIYYPPVKGERELEKELLVGPKIAKEKEGKGGLIDVWQPDDGFLDNCLKT